MKIMRIRFDIIAFLFISMLFVGCKSQKPTVVKNRTVKDSVRITTRIVPQDTLIVVPRDSVSVQVSLEDLGIKPMVAVSESGKVQASISRVKDHILVDCKTEQLELKLQLLNKEIEKLKTTSIVESETKYVPKKYVPWWVKILAWAGAIAIVFVALKTILKSFKPF